MHVRAFAAARLTHLRVDSPAVSSTVQAKANNTQIQEIMKTLQFMVRLAGLGSADSDNAADSVDAGQADAATRLGLYFCFPIPGVPRRGAPATTGPTNVGGARSLPARGSGNLFCFAPSPHPCAPAPPRRRPRRHHRDTHPLPPQGFSSRPSLLKTMVPAVIAQVEAQVRKQTLSPTRSGRKAHLPEHRAFADTPPPTTPLSFYTAWLFISPNMPTPLFYIVLSAFCYLALIC